MPLNYHFYINNNNNNIYSIEFSFRNEKFLYYQIVNIYKSFNIIYIKIVNDQLDIEKVSKIIDKHLRSTC